MKKNSRTQWLTLELLDNAMENCNLAFHQQVCTKEFLQGLITILRIKQIPPPIVAKILNLIQKWAIRFNDQKDILPLFNVVYEELQKRGFKFENAPVKPSSGYEPQQQYASQINTPKLFIEDVEAILLTNVSMLNRK